MMKRSTVVRLTAVIAGTALASLLAISQEGGGGLTVSPSSLSFSATQGGTSPPSQTISVQAGRGTRFTTSISVGSGAANWLSVSPSGTLYTNQTLTVAVNSSGLSSGTYNGTISLTSGQEENRSTQTVSVTLSVTRPTVTVSPTSLTFNATAGGAAPASQTVSVTASRATAFTAAVTGSGTNWLHISPSGSLTTNRTLTVSVNPSGLTAGSYNGVISVAAAGVTRTVTVAFVVSQAASTITVAPSSLTFNATAGGAVPAVQTVSVTANAATNFTATAAVQSGSTNWLTISPTGSLNTNRTLTVSVNPTGLAAGSYNGTISVVSGGVTHTVAVTFAVSSAASTITVAPTFLTFTAIAGGAAPTSQTVSVTANAATNFTATAAIQTGSTKWLAVSPSGSLTTNQTLTVSVTPAGLAAGSYNGTISAVSGGVTRTVAVTFTLTAPPVTLTAAPTSLTFFGTIGTSAPASQTLSVTAAATTAFTAAASIQSGSSNWLTVSPSGSHTTNATLTVSVSLAGLSAGSYAGTVSLVATGSTVSVPVSFIVGTSGTGGGTTFHLIGWNDLGMHCDDGQDYSIFGVLPPYNTIHAHLLDSTGALVVNPAGYTVTYQAITDPLTNTINTTSAPKTNFWQYAAALGFGALAPDVGLKGFAMPGTGNVPQAMNFNTPDNTWLATGIPILNYADAATAPYPKNYFPMMRLTAKNQSGATLATTDIVLPISDELNCGVCHSSGTGSLAAQPAAGWVNNSNVAKDLKLNILRKHDDRFRTTALFQAAAAAQGFSSAGLEAQSAVKPFMCAACHGTNALSLPGYPGVPTMTTSLHGLHAGVTDPATGQSMDSGTSRATCYRCHPGPETQCLRGIMGNLKNAAGGNAIECQSCHGTMSTLADPTRQGWLSEPTCQSCHTGTATSNSGQIVYTSAFSSGTTVRVAADQTFASNANTPATGLSLYRFSSGHGGLQCEGCHGSTHAEVATPIVNDNVQNTTLQGYAGTLAECTACHGSTPATTNGGPHGLHPIGTSWVNSHQDVAGGHQATCQPCHGTDYRGTNLSMTQTDRTLAGKSFPRGTVIGCYSCHNGPNGG